MGIEVYRELLGVAFDSLHAHVRRAHEAPLSALGVAEVTGASNWLGAVVARAMNFPRPGSSVPVRLDVSAGPLGNVWSRDFDGRRVRTVQRAVRGLLEERRGPGRLWFRVSIVDGAVVYESVRFFVFGIVVPRFLSARATGRVTATDDGWRVEIEVFAPLVGRLTRYAARMRQRPIGESG